jgi:hypothetical protein
MKVIYICTILFILIYMITPSISIVYQATEIKKLEPVFAKSLATSVTTESKQRSISSSSIDLSEDEQEPRAQENPSNEKIDSYREASNPNLINVNKRLIDYYIDRAYDNETICVLVQVTNPGDLTLYDIDLREIASDAVSIINCSIPVKMSSIDEILRYQRNRGCLISSSDIFHPMAMAKIIINDSRIKSFLSENFLNEISLAFNSKEDHRVETAILKEFNRLISNEKLYDSVEINEKNLSTQTCKLLCLDRSEGLQKLDLSILNFLILRDFYPRFIKKPDGYMQIYDNLDVDETIGIISIPISSLSPKESLFFAYFAKISQPGKYSMDTVIGLSGKRAYEYTTIPMDVSFLYPSFSIKVIPSKEYEDPGDDIYLKYIVEILSSTNRTLNHIFEAEIRDNTNSIYLNDTKFKLEFSNNNASVTKTVRININEPGSYNIPSIVIKNTEYVFPDKYIQIEERWHKYIAEISLFFLGFCTLVGSNFEAIKKDKKIQIFLSVIFIALLLITLRLIDKL